MKNLSFSKCLAIYAGRIILMILAPILVLVGMLIGKIRKGPLQLGQWNGIEIINGQQVQGKLVESMVCEGFWKNYDAPDETGIGLYEPTVSKIYQKFGWNVAVYYQLALRNVAQGWLYKFKIDLEGDEAAPMYDFHGISYGYKRYQDWRSYPEKGGFLGEPKKYYAIPTIGKG